MEQDHRERSATSDADFQHRNDGFEQEDRGSRRPPHPGCILVSKQTGRIIFQLSWSSQPGQTKPLGGGHIDFKPRPVRLPAMIEAMFV